MSVATPEELVQSYIDAYNRFDLDAMCALLASDIRFEHYANGELGAQASGLREFRLLAETGAALFAEREQRITALRVDGSHADVDIAFTGKLAADVPGGPPAGTVLTLDGSSAFTFDQGCISKIVDRG
jgi:hypothetical protein